MIFISILARSNCTYTCPSDCVVTKYDLIQSGAPRSEFDSRLHITTLSKKNQQLYNLFKEIERLDDLCISPEVKEQMVKELEQLMQSIAYSSNHAHFFWQHDTMVSHVREQVYDLWDMIGIDFYYRILEYYVMTSFPLLQLDLEDVLVLQLDFQLLLQ